MKKRIIGLALVMGLVLSLCASAWADTYHAVLGAYADHTAVHRVTSSRVGTQKTIKLAAVVYFTDSVDIAYSNNAAKVKLSIAPNDILTDATISPSEFTLSTSGNTTGIAVLVGTIAKTGTLTVTAQLVDASGKDCTGTKNSDTATITFDDTDAADTANVDFPTGGGQQVGPYAVPVYEDDDTNPLAGTPADPDSANWDGIDPTFGTKGGNNKDKPKIATSKPAFTKAGATAKALTSGTADTFKVEIQGPLISKTSPDTGNDLSKPHVQIDVYVAAKDAIKLGWLEKGATTNIRLDSADIKKYAIPFRVTSWDVKAGGTDKKPLEITTLTFAYNGAHVAYKGFPITVAVENDKTTKAVTKTYKIDINSDRSVPQWVDEGGKIGDAYNKEATAEANGSWTKKNATEAVISFTDAETVSKFYTVSADGPYTVTQKGIKDGTGLAATAVDPELNKWGEVVTPGYVFVGGSFAQTDKNAGKEQKANVTMTANGGVKKTSAKATVLGKVAPFFDPKKITSKDVDGEERIYLTGIKRVEAGKVPSVKFAAKGSKTITYTIDEYSLAALNDVGLSFDEKKGAVIAKGDKKNIKATLEDDEFASIDICVMAYNDVGETEAWAEVAITGVKPKFTTKTITLSRDKIAVEDDGTVLKEYCDGIELSNASGDHLIFTFADTKSSGDLKAVGLGLDETGYLKVVSSKDIKATKGVKISVNADNYGAVAKGSITVVIADPKPEISGDSTIAFTSLSKDTTGKTIKLALKEDPTGDTKLAWKLKTKPSNKAFDAKLTAAKDGKTATFTVKLKSDLTAAVTSGQTAVITVTNSSVKPNLVGEFTVNITASAASTEGKDEGEAEGSSFKAAVIDESAPEAKADAEAESDEDSAAEPKLTFGKPRTAANLSAAQAEFLAKNGYTVIAVLPEVTADKDGQAEIPAELIEDAPEGAKLVYIPFPKNAEETDDDKIADFYDEDGALIEVVPAAQNITVAPWFRAGVTYEPVIAAEK